jgi:IclR family transcriptional regulator, KDG regulon repressor
MSESVRAVDRALDLLLCFSQEQPTLTLTQLAERMDLSKSTVYRLLTTLEARRFVSRERATGAYSLGYRLMEMASLVLRGVDRHHWAYPYLLDLAQQSGETVDLAVLDGSDVIYLQVVESSHRVKIAATVGQRLPAHCTASGKAFMAFLPGDQVAEILDAGVSRHTPHTRLDRSDLLQDLSATRERGFALSKEEFESEIHAIAAPILDAARYPRAVIAIVGPSYRLPEERMVELGRLAQASAANITHEIGPAALDALLGSRIP